MKYYHVKCDANYCGIFDEKVVKNETKTKEEISDYINEWWQEEGLDYIHGNEDEEDYEFYVNIEEITKEEYYGFIEDCIEEIKL